MRFLRGPGLAFQVLVVVCALTAPGCLVPQSIDAFVVTPHPPPHFVLESIPDYLLQPVLQLYRQGPNDPPCHCYLELSIPFVEEDDPTVTLEARWFLDYDPAVISSVSPVGAPQRLDGNFDTQETIRPLKAFRFDADAFLINSSGLHVVDVVVGELAGFDPASTAQPNRAMKPGYTAAVYRFFVNLKYEPDSTRPNCPAAGASLRVCQ
jgi:hypothetical protein